MSDIAIKVENLSKLYRIGLKEEIHDTLGGAIVSFVRQPVTNLKKLRRLTRFAPEDSNGEDTIWALKDVSFEVKRGEVIGIIGRNGAGKSTLLKILSRITEPTGGRAMVNGRVASLLEVGTGFHQELTGRENVYLNGTILGMSKAEVDNKFDEIVAFAGVERFIDTPVKRYSSGMKVRLAFAVASHLEPEILLVDEVLAVGDAEFQKKCLGKMENVAQQGRTVLFVSHNMGAVTDLCETAILLDSGVITCRGSVGEVVDVYSRLSRKKVESQIAEDNSPLRITSMRVVDTNGEQIEFDQAFSVEVSCRVTAPVPFARINFVLLDARDIKIVHLQTNTDEIGLGKIEPGDYMFFVNLPTLWLVSGTYTAITKFHVIGSKKHDGKVESPYLPIHVRGNLARFKNVLNPRFGIDWQVLQERVR